MNAAPQWLDRASWRIACIGECMVELSSSNNPQVCNFAGDTANVALYLARMGLNKVTVDYVTAVGEDEVSGAMLHLFNREGISTERIRVLKGREPGRYRITTDDRGERQFEYRRDESAARYLLSDAYDRTLRDALLGFDLVYCTGISLAILSATDRLLLLNLLTDLRAAGTLIAIDSNYRPVLWQESSNAAAMLDRLQRTADIALVTFGDENSAFNDRNPNDTLTRLRKSGVSEIVVKNSDRSSLAFCTSNGQVHEVPALTTENVVDTTAAGDSFNAAYLAARIDGLEQKTAVHVAHRLASHVIAYPGALMPRDKTPSIRQLIQNSQSSLDSTR